MFPTVKLRRTKSASGARTNKEKIEEIVAFACFSGSLNLWEISAFGLNGSTSLLTSGSPEKIDVDQAEYPFKIFLNVSISDDDFNFIVST